MPRPIPLAIGMLHIGPNTSVRQRSRARVRLGAFAYREGYPLMETFEIDGQALRDDAVHQAGQAQDRALAAGCGEWSGSPATPGQSTHAVSRPSRLTRVTCSRGVASIASKAAALQELGGAHHEPGPAHRDHRQPAVAGGGVGGGAAHAQDLSGPWDRDRRLGVWVRVCAGGQARFRTVDLSIFSRTLYQLSYLAERGPKGTASDPDGT